MAVERLTEEQRSRLADPSTYAAMDAAQAAGRVLFGPCMTTVLAALSVLLRAQEERSLTGVETVRVTALRACFAVLVAEQKHFVEVDLKRRLDPWSEDEMANT